MLIRRLSSDYYRTSIDVVIFMLVGGMGGGQYFWR